MTNNLRPPGPSSTRHRILQMVAYGLTNSQIGTRLPMSTQGVSYHVGELLKDFRVNSRAALVAKAYAYGYLGAWPPECRNEMSRHAHTRIVNPAG